MKEMGTFALREGTAMRGKQNPRNRSSSSGDKKRQKNESNESGWVFFEENVVDLNVKWEITDKALQKGDLGFGCDLVVNIPKKTQSYYYFDFKLQFFKEEREVTL